MSGPSLQLTTLLAQGQPSALVNLLPIVLIMGIFYVMLILPAQRRQKQTQKMLGALKVGDKVITNGGIYGIIRGFDHEAVLLQVADQVKIKVMKSAVAGLQSEPPAEPS